jgi:hypothetical protein
MHMPLLFFLVVAAQLPNWQANHVTATLERRPNINDSPDPAAIVAGLGLLLQQLPDSCWQARITEPFQA